MSQGGREEATHDRKWTISWNELPDRESLNQTSGPRQGGHLAQELISRLTRQLIRGLIAPFFPGRLIDQFKMPLFKRLRQTLSLGFQEY